MEKNETYLKLIHELKSMIEDDIALYASIRKDKRKEVPVNFVLNTYLQLKENFMSIYNIYETKELEEINKIQKNSKNSKEFFKNIEKILIEEQKYKRKTRSAGKKK